MIKIFRTSVLGLALCSASTAALFAQTAPTRFAVIGDYGSAGTPERDVANRIKSWNPQYVLTTGDNNYAEGLESTIDRNIGQYYSDFIFPYRGTYTPTTRNTFNRFFPIPGNHDWNETVGLQPYMNYFTLPGNERYYDAVLGPVHVFMLNVLDQEPDGRTSTSPQAAWLRERLAASTAPWKLVFCHDPPYSSGSTHGSDKEVRWPFREWGATAVLSGDEHSYERLNVGGFPHFVNGAGGRSLYGFRSVPRPESVVRYNANYGAMQIDATTNEIIFQFITRSGSTVDSHSIRRSGGTSSTPAELTLFTAE